MSFILVSVLLSSVCSCCEPVQRLFHDENTQLVLKVVFVSLLMGSEVTLRNVPGDGGQRIEIKCLTFERKQARLMEL